MEGESTTGGSTSEGSSSEPQDYKVNVGYGSIPRSQLSSNVGSEGYHESVGTDKHIDSASGSKGSSPGDKINDQSTPSASGSWARLKEVFRDIFRANIGEEVEGITFHYDEKGNKVKHLSGEVPALPISPNGAAKLSINAVRLATQLANESKLAASEAQIAEKGLTIIKSTELREAGRLAEQYGGKAADWVKKTSSSFEGYGSKFETHWYENIIESIRVEFKTKF